MVKKFFWAFMAAAMTLSVLLCGCGDEGNEDVILIGSLGMYPGTEASEPGEPDAAQTPVNTEASGNPAPVRKDQELSVIRVYVCGAVVRPGVVEIPGGSRIEDALSAAGGFLPDALAEAVNLADWASDGQMLYFPTAEEAAAWLPVSQDAENEQSGLVNINTAGAALLCSLPGIGEAKAADIIAYREAHGGFGDCEDIMKVPGIKTSIYEKIHDKIRVK